MEFIRTIRERQQTAKQESITKEAGQVITLSDFDNTVYIAYNGIPLIQIADTATSKDIVTQLYILRNNYINAKSKLTKRITTR